MYFCQFNAKIAQDAKACSKASLLTWPSTAAKQNNLITSLSPSCDWTLKEQQKADKVMSLHLSAKLHTGHLVGCNY